MASIAPHPPTSHLSHNPSPQHASPRSQPHSAVPPSSYGNSYSMSFESQHTRSASSAQPAYSQSFPTSQQPSYSNGPVSNPAYARSFSTTYQAQRQPEDVTQIYTAVYSGVSVYEMEVNGIACMRRRSDGWLNATQILKVAGVDKGKRTKVLEKEILTGEHEKVQGGYGKYQGTWISYKRGREFCRQYGVEDVLRPLLEYDVSADGTGGQGTQDTPTKEQAMAANRKRFYNTSVESQRPSGGPISNGTFFQNISPTTSVALAAMNKAAKVNSPGPNMSGMRRPSQQEAFPGLSQHSMMSAGSFNGEVEQDSGYGTQRNGEPPRKRMRSDSRDGMMSAPQMDASMRSVTPTEPSESFEFDIQELANGNGEPVALAPLPSPTSDSQRDKMSLVLDLFSDTGRTNYVNHPALTQLSGDDFNIPLDASANNALHWAATLAKVPLLKLLIQKGANMYRGNAAGQSPLISAVLVNNCWEQSCFSELLDVLGPLIEVRDLQGRTILHHISVSSGIKGRAPSSKYYLEALLGFLVRIGTHPGRKQGDGTAAASQESNNSGSHTIKGGVSLSRFLSHIVNARDKAGNTALQLVARIGNQSIIKQLLEIHADPSLPNYKGVAAKDFGVGVGTAHVNGQSASQQTLEATQETNADVDVSMVSNVSQTEDLSQDVITSLTSMINESVTAHKERLRVRTEQIDALNAQIQESSNLHQQELEEVEQLKERIRVRAERRAKIANLTRVAAEMRARQHQVQRAGPIPIPPPAWLQEIFATDGNPDPANLPAIGIMRAHLKAYTAHVNSLSRKEEDLKSQSVELEGMYRKVVSLCTGVAEDQVDQSLPSLLAAVESEKGKLGVGEVGRVREFLRRVDGGAVGSGGV